MRLISILLFCSTQAWAGAPAFEGVAKEEVAKEDEEPEGPQTDLMVEAGGAMAGGNSIFWIINGRSFGMHKWKRNRIGFSLGANVGASKVDADGDGKLSDAERQSSFAETSRKYIGHLRYDRFLADKDSVYFSTGGFSDRYAGMDLRANAQIGYSRHLIDGEKTTLNAEIGIDLALENFIEGVDPNKNTVLAGRVLIGFSHKLTEDIVLMESAEVYEGLTDVQDVRVNNTLQLSLKVSDALSLKLSHALIFDNVPVEGFRKSDQTSMLTGAVTLF
ncbi:MAG: putative salt-induced outer membrane protein YdiY [Kiritimatiellia bacterium]|jgi:putative salt-induced outer membrane protein YdiY